MDLRDQVREYAAAELCIYVHHTEEDGAGNVESWKAELMQQGERPKGIIETHNDSGNVNAIGMFENWLAIGDYASLGVDMVPTRTRSIWGWDVRVQSAPPLF